VRFAIPAVAAVSGLFLLTLAFYGQPAVYLQQARDQWDELMDRPIANPPLPAADAEGRLAPRQPDPAPRDGDRAAKQDPSQRWQVPKDLPPALTLDSGAGSHLASAPPAPSPGESAPHGSAAASPPGPASVAPPPALTPPVVAFSLPTPQPEASQPPPVPPIAASAPPPPPATPVPERHEAGIGPAATVPKSGQPEPAKPEPAKPEPARSEQVMQAQSQRARPDEVTSQQGKSQQAKQEQIKSEQAKPEQAKPEPARTEPPKVEPSKRDQARSDPPKPQSPKPDASSKTVVAQRPIPAPPPLPPSLVAQATMSQAAPPQSPPQQLSPAPKEADDTESVLARLRQLSPSVPVAQQGDTSPAPEPRPRPTSSSSLSRLNAARSALAGGQIEDARRLLQQVQLQLVFGPVDAPEEGSPAAGKGAVDVAHALDALSANDVPLSRRYIDVAMGDLSGSPTNPPIQQSDRRASGYAPAYPPR
jgi:hypothetical protein